MTITADELLVLLKARDDASRVVNQFRKNFAQVGKDIARIGQQMSMRVTLPIIAIGAGLFKMAAEAVESENLFTEAMGDMAASTRLWSEDMREQLGLNDFEMRKQVSTLYLMTSAMGIQSETAQEMSQTLTELVYDMASFRNLRVEEAFEKITAGITGEMEPLKRIGILVNEATVRQALFKAGLIESGEAITDQQKILGRYLTIMQQTVKDQGDLARTMDSPINQIRILTSDFKLAAIELGTELMPHFKSLIGLGKDLMGFLKDAVIWFANLSREQQTTIVRAVALLAAVGPLLVVFGNLIRLVSGTAVAVKTLIPLLGGLSGGMAIAAAGIGLIVIEFIKAREAVDDYRDAVELQREQTIGIYKEWGEKIRGLQAANMELYNEWTLRVEELREGGSTMLHAWIQAWAEFRRAGHEAFQDPTESADDFQSKIDAMMASLRAMFDIPEPDELPNYLDEAAIAAEIAAKQMDALKDALRGIKYPSEEEKEELAETAGTAGQEVGRSLVEGIIKGADAKDLADRFMSIMEDLLIDKVAVLLGFASPSKVYYDFGKGMMQGLHGGIAANMGMIGDQLASLVPSGFAGGVAPGMGFSAPAPVGPAAPAASTVPGAQGRNVVIENINLQVGFGSDGERLEAGRRVLETLDELS